jgi:hypothetical protein
MYNCNSKAVASTSSFSNSSVSPRSGPATATGGGKMKSMRVSPMRAAVAPAIMQTAKAPRLPPPDPAAAPQLARIAPCNAAGSWQSCKWQPNYGRMGRLS